MAFLVMAGEEYCGSAGWVPQLYSTQGLRSFVVDAKFVSRCSHRLRFPRQASGTASATYLHSRSRSNKNIVDGLTTACQDVRLYVTYNRCYCSGTPRTNVELLLSYLTNNSTEHKH